MRTLTRISLLASLAVIANSAMAATKYVAADASIESQLCVSSATASPLQFHTQVRDSGISLRTVARKITCNDVPIGRFAADAGNVRNGQRLLRLNSVDGHVEIRDEVSQNATPSLLVASADRVVYIKGR